MRSLSDLRTRSSDESQATSSCRFKSDSAPPMCSSSTAVGLLHIGGAGHRHSPVSGPSALGLGAFTGQPEFRAEARHGARALGRRAAPAYRASSQWQRA